HGVILVYGERVLARGGDGVQRVPWLLVDGGGDRHARGAVVKDRGNDGETSERDPDRLSHVVLLPRETAECRGPFPSVLSSPHAPFSDVCVFTFHGDGGGAGAGVRGPRAGPRRRRRPRARPRARARRGAQAGGGAGD